MVETIRWDGRHLWVLDQTKLPHIVQYRKCASASDVADAIRSMQVRGAPAIGVTAAFGMLLGVVEALQHSAPFHDFMKKTADMLRATRPTAVNLFWAIGRMMEISETSSLENMIERMEAAAERIYLEDIESCRSIGKHGADLIPEQACILTHCNAGALATAGYGTALGVIRAAVEQGKRIRVFADETRPFLQGARLTAWELLQDHIDTTLITDSMAAYFMRIGEIDLVVVGADRIAANGDTANKIGTYSVALAAKAHQIPFYVAAPISTIDLSITSGDAIPIEERDPQEVKCCSGTAVAPADVKARHPAFDVTPNSLITAIITDRGVAVPPFAGSLKSLF